MPPSSALFLPLLTNAWPLRNLRRRWLPWRGREWYHPRDSMITLTVNGKQRELDKATALDLFLKDNGIDGQFVAVAYNGTVLHRDEFPNVTLGQDDVVEIVRPVGGG